MTSRESIKKKIIYLTTYRLEVKANSWEINDDLITVWDVELFIKRYCNEEEKKILSFIEKGYTLSEIGKVLNQTKQNISLKKINVMDRMIEHFYITLNEEF